MELTAQKRSSFARRLKAEAANSLNVPVFNHGDLTQSII